MRQLDRERLALRIERLMLHRDTSEWHPADAFEFNTQAPNSRVSDPRLKLPTPEHVRSDGFTEQEYRDAVQRCLRLETLAHENRPGSVKRAMRDARRGRFPFWR